jgi:hypothetical protein
MMRYDGASNAAAFIALEAPMRSIALAVVVTGLVSGCNATVVEHTPTSSDPPISVGARKMLGYRVAANADTIIPAGDIGYLVTASGQGSFRLIWIDTANSPATFSGTITMDGNIDTNYFQRINGAENITIQLPSTIIFSSVPGATKHGVDFATLERDNSFYLDALVDNSRDNFGIFFTGAGSGDVLESLYDPVAFTSP